MSYPEGFCPYCGHQYPTEQELIDHQPCSDPIGDTHPFFGVPERLRPEEDEEAW